MSKVIKILGTGCAKCQSTAKVVEDVVKENKLDVTIEKVEDIMKIMEYNIISTPAIVVDELITIKGRVPSKEEVEDLLLNNKLDNKDECCSGKKCC